MTAQSEILGKNNFPRFINVDRDISDTWEDQGKQMHMIQDEDYANSYVLLSREKILREELKQRNLNVNID